MKKNIIITTIILAISIIGNFYYFGSQIIEKEKTKYFQAGADAVIQQIINEAKNGEVRINTENETIILIKK
jgi:hypothetical protein